MIKQIIEIGNEKAKLSVQHRQLVIRYEDGRKQQRSIEDIGMIIFDHAELSYSQALLQELLKNNVAILITDDQHLPVGQLFPFVSNKTQTQRIRAQVTTKRPLNKQLWQTIIQAKIRNQGKLLKHLHQHDGTLFAIAKDVNSGDTSNREAYASKLYWQLIFGELDFRRNRDKADINMALNYGYVILRSAIARAIAATGLHASIGIHHSNKYNAFCMADDLIEPLRPLVDYEAVQILNDFGLISKLTREVRTRLLQILNKDVIIDQKNFPLLEGLQRYAASLSASYINAENRLEIPKWLF